MHLQLNTLFDIDLRAKYCPVPPRTCDLCTYRVLSTASKGSGRKFNIQYVAQYPLHNMTYPAPKFEVATSNRLGGDTFTRKYII